MRFYLKVCRQAARLRDELTAHPGLYALAALGGLLYALGFCGYDQWYLAWICLVPTLLALGHPVVGARRALALGWLSGFVAHLGCYTWIVHMLRFFAYLPWPLAIPIYLLLCAAQSSLFGAWSLGSHWLARRARMPLGLASACCMVLAEWLYPALFPSYLANSQYLQLSVLQGLELWGTLGLSFIMMASMGALRALLAHRWQDQRLRPLGILGVGLAALCVAGNLAFGQQALGAYATLLGQAKQRIKVGLVQTNMGIYEKSENPIEGLRRHRAQSRELEAQGAQLIVWPESGYYFGIETGTLDVKDTVMGALHTPLLFGGLRIDRGPQGRRLYNAAFLANGQGTLLASYDKTMLLAFGEYLPLGDWFPSLYDLSPQTLRMWRGEHVEPLQLEGLRFGVLICYEDILPHFVRRVAQRSPDVLVNLTNDAWFGKSYEPRIHMALALCRAVEHRRFLLRATNTGVSSIIEPTGKIQAQSGVFERSSLLGEFVPQRRTTFYGAWGDWVGYLCASSVLGFALASRRSRGPQLLRALGRALRGPQRRAKRALS